MTPSFNQNEYLEATLQSVLSQGYPDLNYVVIDGGSTDGSAATIARHEADLAYWVSEPDSGHADAINKGFAHTTGEIMCWINSSDLYYPWTFETIAQIFSSAPPGRMDHGHGLDVRRDGRTAPGLDPMRRVAFNTYDVLAGDYRWLQQESVFWRRTLWERAGGRLDQGADPRGRLRPVAALFSPDAAFDHVQTVLGGFRVHGNRLADAGDGLYEREARQVHARFTADHDRKSRARARLVRLAGARGARNVGDNLNKIGVLDWYRHPRLEFDCDRMVWLLR